MKNCGVRKFFGKIVADTEKSFDVLNRAVSQHNIRGVTSKIFSGICFFDDDFQFIADRLHHLNIRTRYLSFSDSDGGVSLGYGGNSPVAIGLARRNLRFALVLLGGDPPHPDPVAALQVKQRQEALC